MRSRGWAVAVAILVLGGCADEQEEVATVAPYLKDGVCDVQASTLGDARERFAEVCGGLPRDCDPAGSAWSCSSVVIGSRAPERIIAERADACEVDGASLGAARERFVAHCGVTPRDCDPLAGGGWMCSTAVIGEAAPVRAPDADRGADPFIAGLDMVSQWNELALASIARTGARPTVSTHQLFLLSAAMYDAWALHAPVAAPYASPGSYRRPATERTPERQREAVAFAAHTVLSQVFPGVEARNGWFTEHLHRLGLDPSASDGAAGVGRRAALAVMHERRDDGSNSSNDYAAAINAIYPRPYEPVNGAGAVDRLGEFEAAFDPNRWQPLRVPNGSLVDDDARPLVDELNLDSFGDQQFLTPHWGSVTPFALSHGSELRPSPPPLHGSDAPYVDALGNRSTNHDAWVRQFTEVVRFSAELTDEHKIIAEFWADGPRTEAPPGHWNQLAHGLIERDGLDLEASVKLYFTMNAGLLDAGIATWEAKRFYDFIRPATAVRFLFRDAHIDAWAGPNRGTESIPGSAFSPYQQLTFVTPPFPEYVSGHSTFSRVSADILTALLGSDRFYDGSTRTLQDVNGDGERDFLGEHVAPAGSFLVERGPVEDVVLRWHTLREAADEAGLSRLYGGIHIQDGDLRGRELGARVAERVLDRAHRYFRGESD